MHNLKELKIWNKAIDIAVEVYKVTANFPKEEKYNLISQTRRSAVSIPSNIAEGAGRNSNNEFIHFLGIANGSSYELQTQLMISNRLELISEGNLNPLLTSIDELQKMTYSFQNTLSNR
jgi:four helix bundle protein